MKQIECLENRLLAYEYFPSTNQNLLLTLNLTE